MDRRTRVLLRRWLERRWTPSLHPRGPDGRFTESSAAPATPTQRRRIDYVRRRPKPRRAASRQEATAQLTRIGRVGPEHLASLGDTNRALRAGNTPPDNTIAAAMAPIPEAVQAFRSVPRSEFGNVAPEDLRGFVVRDAGFFPASAAPTTPVPGEVRMTIDVPEGTRVAASPDTHELVLDAGTELHVDEVTTEADGSTSMHLTALPTEGADGPGSGEPDTGSTDVPDADSSTSEPGADFDARADAALQGDDARRATSGSMVPDRSQLSSREHRAFESYRAIDYGAMNNMLRNGFPAEPDAVDTRRMRQIDLMDGVMGASPLTDEVVTYRGLDGSRLFGDRLNGDLTGFSWREDSFVSTSSDENVARGFADPGVLMRIITPPGVGAVELSDGSYESELLLQRGLQLRVVADRGESGGNRHIDVEVVPIDAN